MASSGTGCCDSGITACNTFATPMPLAMRHWPASRSSSRRPASARTVRCSRAPASAEDTNTRTALIACRASRSGFRSNGCCSITARIFSAPCANMSSTTATARFCRTSGPACSGSCATSPGLTSRRSSRFVISSPTTATRRRTGASTRHSRCAVSFAGPWRIRCGWPTRSAIPRRGLLRRACASALPGSCGAPAGSLPTG
jgi:hypothetical protein